MILTTRSFYSLAAISTLLVFAVTPSLQAQNKGEVRKAVKKADRQILSYSPEKARKLLEPVIGADDPQVEAAIGQILMLEKNYDGAIEKLQAAAKKSKDPMVLVALGDAYAYAKDNGKSKSAYQEAADQAKSTLNKKASDSDAQFALGVAQQRLKDYDQAIDSLAKAQSADASNPRIAFELGLTQMLKGNNQAAFDALSQAIEGYSGYAYAYYYRALAADKIGRKDVTVNDLDRFLALAPSAPEASKAQRILQAARG